MDSSSSSSSIVPGALDSSSSSSLIVPGALAPRYSRFASSTVAHPSTPPSHGQPRVRMLGRRRPRPRRYQRPAVARVTVPPSRVRPMVRTVARHELRSTAPRSWGALSRRQRVRPQSCTLCHRVVTIRMRRHLGADHFPWFLDPMLCCWTCRESYSTLNVVQRFHSPGQEGHGPESLLTESNLRRWVHLMRGYILHLGRLLGCTDLESLLAVVVEKQWYPEDNTRLTDLAVTLFRMIEVHLNTPHDSNRSGYLLSPPNRLAILFHWRIIHEIHRQLPLSSVQDARNFVSDDRMVTTPLPPYETVDSHGHLEQMLRRHWTNRLDEICFSVGEDRVFCSHLLCCLAYPSSWQSLTLFENMNAVYFQFGLHPRIASSPVADNVFSRLIDLTRHPRCVAVGEVGLDYQDADEEGREHQQTFLGRVAAFVSQTELPLVLHVRHDDDPAGVFIDAIPILRRHLHLGHPLYFHHFAGDLPQLQICLRLFPRSYFGLGRRVLQHSEEIDRLILDMPLDRILLESDCPYQLSTPWALAPVIATVARVRNITSRMVCEIARLNAMRLFRL